MSIKDGNFLHSNKNINLHNFFSRYLGININKSIFSCKSDYEILHNIYKQIKKNKSVVLHDESYKHKKAERQINEIAKFLEPFPIETKKEKDVHIVDIGCGNGLLTKEFVNLYDLHGTSIYVGAVGAVGVCVETQNYLDKSVIDLIKFSITDGKKINLENNFANITICYLSLHHFISIDAMMDEIIRIIKPNAYLLIYEHDCISPNNVYLLDLYHIINELLLNPHITNFMDNYKKFVNSYYSNYTSKKILIQRLSNNFNLIKSKKVNAGFINNYYALFQKK